VPSDSGSDLTVRNYIPRSPSYTPGYPFSRSPSYQAVTPPYIPTSPSYTPRPSPGYQPTSPSYVPCPPQAVVAPADQAVVAPADQAVVAPADQAVVAPAGGAGQGMAQASSSGSVSDDEAKSILIKKNVVDEAETLLKLTVENNKETAILQDTIQKRKREIEEVDAQIESLNKRREVLGNELKQTEHALAVSRYNYETNIVETRNKTSYVLDHLINPDTD
jgi:hypothetical protein